MKPSAAKSVLDASFLEARSKILDLAAILDRIDRGGGLEDARLERLRQALHLLDGQEQGRAERVQHLFSLGYDPDWPKPQPRP